MAPGSKSEHSGVVLNDGSNTYSLRRQGGNPFQDDEVSNLVGKNIECEGILHGNTVIYSDVTILG